jgi:glucose-6-phosphate isomerase, archaeal
MPVEFGLNIKAYQHPLGFEYGDGVTGPRPELRTLDSIRHVLRDPQCAGPDPVYAIAMDVARTCDVEQLRRRMLLFGIVTYVAGRLGAEPVRSQGHLHRVSRHSGWSPPELYEIWSGRAVILMQEFVAEDPGRVYGVKAAPGERVLVPPGWAHATISADPDRPLTFLALCDREYGFDYSALRARQGLSWYPLVTPEGGLNWEPNPSYRQSHLRLKSPGSYTEFGVVPDEPLYCQVMRDPDRFYWVSRPDLASALWPAFVP